MTKWPNFNEQIRLWTYFIESKIDPFEIFVWYHGENTMNLLPKPNEHNGIRIFKLEMTLNWCAKCCETSIKTIFIKLMFLGPIFLRPSILKRLLKFHNILNRIISWEIFNFIENKNGINKNGVKKSIILARIALEFLWFAFRPR